MYKPLLTFKLIFSVALFWPGINISAQTANAYESISNAQDIHFTVVTRSQDDIGFVIAGMTQDPQGFCG